MFVITLSDIIAIICLVPIILVLIAAGLISLYCKMDDKIRNRRKRGDKSE